MVDDYILIEHGCPDKLVSPNKEYVLIPSNYRCVGKITKETFSKDPRIDFKILVASNKACSTCWTLEHYQLTEEETITKIIELKLLGRQD